MKLAVFFATLGGLVVGVGIPLSYVSSLYDLDAILMWLFQLGWLGAAYFAATVVLGGAAGLVIGLVVYTVHWLLGAEERSWARWIYASLGLLAGGLVGYLLGTLATTLLMVS